jgi:hypothetical protein
MVAEAMTAYQVGVEQRLRQAELERASAQVQAKEEHKRRRLRLALAASVFVLVGLFAGVGSWFGSQRAQASREAAGLLELSADLQKHHRWDEARKALAQASSRVEGFGSGEYAAIVFGEAGWPGFRFRSWARARSGRASSASRPSRAPRSRSWAACPTKGFAISTAAPRWCSCPARKISASRRSRHRRAGDRSSPWGAAARRSTTIVEPDKLRAELVKTIASGHAIAIDERDGQDGDNQARGQAHHDGDHSASLRLHHA